MATSRGVPRIGRLSISRGPRRGGPRERLVEAGVAALSDDELLAIILGHGTGGTSARRVAAQVLEACDGLHGLTRVTTDELRHTPGIGPAQAARIHAATELGRRTLAPHVDNRPQLSTAADCAAYLVPRFGAFAMEHFGILLLDIRHRVLRARVQSVGGLDAAPVSPRDVFRAALGAGAAGLILFHNHPSGDPSPSPDDITLTRRLSRAGQVVGIPVVDHLILTASSFVSLRTSGLLDLPGPS